jgi:AcrR family transcriptional regulator
MIPRTIEFRVVATGPRETDSPGKILEAAIQEFDEVGYDGASINTIALRAGVSKSLVNYHFPTKDSLAATIVNLGHPSGVFMGTPRRTKDPLGEVLAAAEHVSTCVAHHQLARVIIRLVRRRDIRDCTNYLAYSGWLARVSDYLEEGRQSGAMPEEVDVTTQSRLLVAGVSGLIQMAVDLGDYRTLVEDALQLTHDRLEALTRH